MNIALIGPHGVGKTVLGKPAAKATKLTYYSLDTARSQYFLKYGYKPRQAEQYMRQNDTVALFKYWKPFAIQTIQEIIPQKKDYLFDLGASFIILPTDAEITALHDLAEAHNTKLILVLPSDDPEVSKQFLSAEGIYNELTQQFLDHYETYKITSHVFFTAGHTQTENIQRLIDLIHHLKAY